MPRINIGDPWEIKFRKDVRRITRGLTASGNGRGAIKSTQLLWKRDKELNQSLSGTSNAKGTHYACVKALPWQKKSSGRNLEIIKKSVEEIKETPSLNFKEVINKNAIEYDLKYLESGSKAIVPHTYRGITKDHSENLEYYDDYIYEELPDSHEIKIRLSNQEYKNLQKIKKELDLEEAKVIKTLISQYVEKIELENTEIIKTRLDPKEAAEVKKVLAKYVQNKSLKDKNPEIKFWEEENSKTNNAYSSEEVWDSLRNYDEELSREGFFRNISSILNNKTLEMMHKILENDSEKSAKLILVEKFLAFEKSKIKFKKEFQSELDLTAKIFKDRMKNFNEDDLKTLIASMTDRLKKEQLKEGKNKSSTKN